MGVKSVKSRKWKIHRKNLLGRSKETSNTAFPVRISLNHASELVLSLDQTPRLLTTSSFTSHTYFLGHNLLFFPKKYIRRNGRIHLDKVSRKSESVFLQRKETN